MLISENTYKRNEKRLSYTSNIRLYIDIENRNNIESFQRGNFFYVKITKNGETLKTRRLSRRQFQEIVNKPHIIEL